MNATKRRIVDELMAAAADSEHAAGAGLLGAIAPLVQLGTAFGLVDRITDALPEEEEACCLLLREAAGFLAGLCALPPVGEHRYDGGPLCVRCGADVAAQADPCAWAPELVEDAGDVAAA